MSPRKQQKLPTKISKRREDFEQRVGLSGLFFLRQLRSAKGINDAQILAQYDDARR
jgi:hypothetical protein